MCLKNSNLSFMYFHVFSIVISLINMGSSQNATSDGNVNSTTVDDFEEYLQTFCEYNTSNPLDFRLKELNLFKLFKAPVPNKNSSLSDLERFITDVNEFVASDDTSGDITLPSDYNPSQVPVRSDFAGLPVWVALLVYKVLDIDEKNGAVVLDTEFLMRWRDAKITDFMKKQNWTNPTTKQGYESMILNPEFLKRVWKPDLIFDEMLPGDWDPRENESKMTTVQLFVAEVAGFSVTERKKLKLKCEMEFNHYPADTQTCVFYIRSYSYPDYRLGLHWSYTSSVHGLFFNDPTDANFDLQLAYAHDNGNFLIQENFTGERQGTYSALAFEVKLRRKLSYHLVQTYLPSVILILITWLCFLLPADMVEARIGISMTTLLTLTAMFATVREQSPKVSYTMAIDVWIVFCIFVVFLALLLFTVMYWMRLRLQRKIVTWEKSLAAGLEGEEESDDFATMENYKKVVTIAKRYGFWTFSTVFVLFFIVYWTWLLMASKYLEWNPNPKFNAVMDEYDYNGNKVQNSTSVYTHTPFHASDGGYEGISLCRLRKIVAALEINVDMMKNNATPSGDLKME